MASKPVTPSESYRSPKSAPRDPTLPPSIAATSKAYKLERIAIQQQQDVPFRKRCCKYLYNKEENTFCGRTCISWLYIISYSIVYLCFLCSFTCFCLYGALWIIRLTTDFHSNVSLLTYSEYGVGLSATPTSITNQALIWYRKGHAEDYHKYIASLDNLLIKKRRKRDVGLLGPCGEPPYGYNDNKPCVILRINKQLHWTGKPLEANSSQVKIAPLEVQNWLKMDRKLWLHCGGLNSYDTEHIGRIQYYPYPPGFDPDVFPLGTEKESPLIAIQISDFTSNVSLVVGCKLWYENGPGSVEFVLYVASSNDRTVSNRSYV